MYVIMKNTLNKFWDTIQNVIVNNRGDMILLSAYMIAGITTCIANSDTIPKRDFVAALGFIFVESSFKSYYKWKNKNK